MVHTVLSYGFDLMRRQFTARKPQKGVFKVNLCNKNLKFGSCGIISRESGFITTQQLEAIRRVIMKFLIKSGYIWIRLHYKHIITAKPKEVRMGKGKGAADYNVYRVDVGQVLFEFYEIEPMVFQKLLKILQNKVSIVVEGIGL